MPPIDLSLLRAGRPLAVALCCAALPAAGLEPELADAGPEAAEASAADDEASLEALLAEPINSAASRSAESSSEAPATTWSISGTDLKRYGIQSVEEAIRFLGHAMTSYEYDGRLNAAFGARGYLSDEIGLHLAVLVDGNQAGGSALTARGSQHALIPIELIDHLELVIGPGSVVYGNSAMLGVVNLVTRSASSLPGTTVVAQASAGTPADKWARDLSWGEVWARAAAYGGHTFQLGGDPFELAWHLAARWDRQQGRSVWRPTGAADPFEDPLAAFSREDVFNRNFHSRLFGRATWGRWVFLSWVALSQGSGTGPIDGSGASSTLEAEYAFDATWARQVGAHGDLSLRLYGVVFDSRGYTVPAPPDEAHCLATVGTSRCGDTLQYLSVRPFVEPIFTWDWHGDGAHRTTLGAQAFVDGSVITSGVAAADGSRRQLDAPIVAPLPNVAAYAQHVWRGHLGTLNVGLRGDVGLMGSAISPRIALSRGVWKDGTLKLLFSTGFRTPTITERFLEIEHFVTSNPAIRPERVASAELDLAQRLGPHRFQLAVFGTAWEGLISTRSVTVGGESVTQFANLRDVWGAGVNAGWSGEAGPCDWALSVNYAPGRVRLPPDVAQYTEQQLADAGLKAQAFARFGWRALGSVLMPVGGLPDFYATGHVSLSLGERLPRLAVAATVSSPRLQVGYENDPEMIDPRNVSGPGLPWSVEVRGAVEQRLGDRVGLRLTVSGRTLATVADIPRVGSNSGPQPQGGLGSTSNPVAPLSAMAEVHFDL